MSNDKKNISLIFPNQLFKNSDLILFVFIVDILADILDESVI